MKNKNEIEQIKEVLSAYVDENEKLKFWNQVEMMLERLQQEAFLEGYTYAIKLLQESIPRKQNN